MSTEKEFPIYVKTLTGSNTEFRIRGDEKISAVKARLQAQLATPVVSLMYKQKQLDESQTVSEAGIAEESIVAVITEAEKPCHFFFALDESGSMTGGRWSALLQAFAEFVDKQHATATKNGLPLQDRVTVFFHETSCRLANMRRADGAVVPFSDAPIAEITGGSLVNDFRGGGNHFEAVLGVISPFLRRCEGFTPVLLFMTDGGDCGSSRQGAYDMMAGIKQALPELRTYVTTVFTNDARDIDGAKKLCAAAGMDVATHYAHIEDDGSSNSYYYSSYPAAAPPLSALSHGAYYPAPTGYAPPLMSLTSAAPPMGYGPPLMSQAPMMAAMPAPAAYAPASAGSAQRKMASYWDNVYSSNCLQKME